MQRYNNENGPTANHISHSQASYQYDSLKYQSDLSHNIKLLQGRCCLLKDDHKWFSCWQTRFTMVREFWKAVCTMDYSGDMNHTYKFLYIVHSVDRINGPFVRNPLTYLELYVYYSVLTFVCIKATSCMTLFFYTCSFSAFRGFTRETVQ